MGSTISMTCCSSEEIIPDDNRPYVPTIYTYPEYNLPRSNSELTKLALEDIEAIEKKDLMCTIIKVS